MRATCPWAATRLWLASGLSAWTLAAALAAAEPPPAGGQVSGPADNDPRRALVDEFVKKAEALLISDRNYDAKSTAHYKVKTDDPRFDVAAAAQLLEGFRSYFDAFWSGRAELRPYEEPSRILLFYSRYKFKQLAPEALDVGDLTRVGHYQPFFDVVALHTDSVGSDDFPDLLVHEAAHQLVDKRLFGPDIDASLWVEEGLANYFGYTARDAKGKYQTAEIGGKAITLFKDAARSPKRMGAAQGRAFRSALKADKVISLDQVLRTVEPEIFYDASAEQRYMASWLLVHYLFHADGGSHGAAFAAYLKHAAAGDGGADMFYRDLGMTRESLDAAFREYVKRLDL